MERYIIFIDHCCSVTQLCPTLCDPMNGSTQLPYPSLFMSFGPEACGILAPQPGIKLTPSALEGEVLTTGLPGKSLVRFLILSEIQAF